MALHYYLSENLIFFCQDPNCHYKDSPKHRCWNHWIAHLWKRKNAFYYRWWVNDSHKFSERNWDLSDYSPTFARGRNHNFPFFVGKNNGKAVHLQLFVSHRRILYWLSGTCNWIFRNVSWHYFSLYLYFCVHSMN